MTFDLDPSAIAGRDAALAVARDVLAPAAAGVDASAEVPEALRAAMRAVVPSTPATGRVDWTIAVETLATASPALALVAAGDALGVSATAMTAQWSGLRGVDVDGLGRALDGDTTWHVAVTAALVGAARAAVDAGVASLKAARTAGAANDAAQPLVADAATAVDASRLLLWDAARLSPESDAAALARGMARFHVLDSVTLAWQAAERACGAEAFRPGTPLERLRRDAVTLAQVLGDREQALAAVAAGALPA